MQNMGLHIMSHLIFQGILVEIKFPLIFKTFICIPLLLDMVLNISDLHTIIGRSILDLFYKYQVFHQKNPRIFVII